MLEEPLDEDPEDEEEEEAGEGSPQSDEEFGPEFPRLFNAPIVNEDELVRDPVTSGNDTALGAPGSGDEGDE